MAKEKKVTKQDIMKYRGYKFYKELEDGSFEIFRFTGGIEQCKDDPDDFILDTLDEVGTGVFVNLGKIKYSEMKEEYTPIKPEGIVSFNIVYMEDSQTKDALRDVLVLMYKNIDLAIGIQEPFAVCRQSVNDFFSDFVVKDVTNNNLVGICCTRENCPTNIDYKVLLSCSGIQRSDIVSYYKDDTFDTLMQCIPVEKYDKVLNNLYEDHIKVSTDPIVAAAGEVNDGWCRSLSKLLEINNAMVDFNYMNNILGFDFDLADHLKMRDTGVMEMDRICTLFLSEVTKCRISETRVTEFNYSIDMSKFNNTNYTLIRDKGNKMYLVVYLESGEFLEEELQDEINKLDVTDRLRLKYYNKYNNIMTD